MKRGVVVPFIILIALASVIVLVYSFRFKSKPLLEMKNSTTGFAVVELFTSEGCSSCPAADAAVAELLSQKNKDVYILSFHVDYWNRLGWTDAFSQPAFSARQGTYAEHFSLNGVYTPQVVVNGLTEFVGSDENKLHAAVENNLHKEAVSDLNINANRMNNTLTVNYTISEPHAVFLHIALVQPEATTVVKKGENGGRTLHHVNIVRALQTADVSGKGYLTVEIPAALAGTPLQLIAYTQSKENFSILGAIQKEL